MTQATNGNPAGRDAVLQPLTEFWSRYMQSTNEHAKSFMDAALAAFDVPTLRRRWLDTLNTSLEEYFRTPAFLEAMKHHMEAITFLKAYSEDAAEELAQNTGVPRATDISGLFERLRTGQDALSSRLSAIERRLGTIEQRFPPAAG